jgi:hypothetical protein
VLRKRDQSVPGGRRPSASEPARASQRCLGPSRPFLDDSCPPGRSSRAPGLEIRLAGLARAAPDGAPSLLWRHAAPDPIGLAFLEGEAQAGKANGALLANRLRRFDAGRVVGEAVDVSVSTGGIRHPSRPRAHKEEPMLRWLASGHEPAQLVAWIRLLC